MKIETTFKGAIYIKKPTRDLLQITAFKGSLAALRDGDMCN